MRSRYWNFLINPLLERTALNAQIAARLKLEPIRVGANKGVEKFQEMVAREEWRREFSALICEG